MNKQLVLGIKEEKEHKGLVDTIRKQLSKYGKLKLSDKEIYEIIAKDHLKNNPEYYTKLKKYVEPDKEKMQGCTCNNGKCEYCKSKEYMKKDKVAVVMKEWKQGKLKHGSTGKVVPKHRKDIALAIAMSEKKRGK